MENVWASANVAATRDISDPVATEDLSESYPPTSQTVRSEETATSVIVKMGASVRRGGVCVLMGTQG